MNCKYRDTQIFYDYHCKNTELTDVFLHGWGCNSESLKFCKDFTKNSTLFLDFPPFGKSGKDPEGWTIFTYANMVISLCQKLGIKKVNLIGHSFGGRVAIIVSALCKKEVEKLVLVDSAGIKPKRGLKYYIKIYQYKLAKKRKKDISKFGSSDYLALSPNMQQVFKSVVNTHLQDFLPQIQAKTLIIFGENDTTTPLYMAKKLKKHIKNSKLVVLPAAGHFCFLDKKLEFVSILKEFLQEEKCS